MSEKHPLRLNSLAAAAALTLLASAAIAGPAQAQPADPNSRGQGNWQDNKPTSTIELVGINDFHGRIEANDAEAGAAVLAGAVKDYK
ncbi:hypothetical protein OIU93_07415 [Paeniglutamicibacter sp. ZC-3]|uniref:hypothetical protein n=1 Tax=Paeniglutamicibacter sp. ZC-3 TaxID=2986919 RepID=UPI0021F78A6D|nr:hypothetical protein [Paeniglutamicibacter sp. ZC-3]MCV9994127.1 hypothetical protein [Paeniglutamicibacter sp. ZC-3]